MSVKYLLPAVLVTLLAGCASSNAAAPADPVRARVVAELEQARKDGAYPPSEADYIYPNWLKTTAGSSVVVMSDGHPEPNAAKAPATATAAARRATGSTPVAALMTDGHPESAVPATGKGSNSAN